MEEYYMLQLYIDEKLWFKYFLSKRMDTQSFFGYIRHTTTILELIKLKE